MRLLAEILLAAFFISYFIDKRTVLNGKLLCGSMLCFMIYLLQSMQNSPHFLVSALGFFLLWAIMTVLPLLFFSVGAAMIFNGFLLIKFEGKRLCNLLSFAVGLGMFTIFLFIFYLPIYASNHALYLPMPIYYGIVGLVGYFTFLFVSFLVSSMLFNLNKPKLDQDFIIILGCGLLYDKPSPLLMQRIDAGYNFYKKQQHYNDSTPIFIVSGGQGADEKLAEAVVMKMELLARGIPDEKILVEDHSRTTYENLIYSKEMMDAVKPKYRCVIATHNYHLFRAGIYARKAGLKRAEGIGAPTVSYYLPMAFLREFIAYLNMNKAINLYIILFVLFVSVFFTIRSVL